MTVKHTAQRNSLYKLLLLHHQLQFKKVDFLIVKSKGFDMNLWFFHGKNVHEDDLKTGTESGVDFNATRYFGRVWWCIDQSVVITDALGVY